MTEANKNPYQELMDHLERNKSWLGNHYNTINQALLLAAELHGCRKVYGVYDRYFDHITSLGSEESANQRLEIYADKDQTLAYVFIQGDNND